jgi:phospholipid/cholesterol/gamma-HCH transport system substrate-binding protein
VQDSTKQMNELLKQLTATTTEQRQQLAKLDESLRKAADGLEATVTRPELQSTIKKTDEAMTHMNEASASFQRSATSIEAMTDRMAKGEGTLGKLTKDDALYKNLNEAVVNANKLLEDFREHPRRYVKLSFF